MLRKIEKIELQDKPEPERFKMLTKVILMEDQLDQNQIANIDSPEVLIEMARTIYKLATQDAFRAEKATIYHLFRGIHAMEIVSLKFGRRKYPAAGAVLNDLHRILDDILNPTASEKEDPS